jgi:PAS domain S-box-containing protein
LQILDAIGSKHVQLSRIIATAAQLTIYLLAFIVDKVIGANNWMIINSTVAIGLLLFAYWQSAKGQIVYLKIYTQYLHGIFFTIGTYLFLIYTPENINTLLLSVYLLLQIPIMLGPVLFSIMFKINKWEYTLAPSLMFLIVIGLFVAVDQQQPIFGTDAHFILAEVLFVSTGVLLVLISRRLGSLITLRDDLIYNLTTELKVANADLESRNKELASRYKGLFSNSKQAILLIDAQCGIIDVNKYFELITGFSHSEVLNRHLSDISKNTDRELFLKFANSNELDQVIDFDNLELTKKNGDIAFCKAQIKLSHYQNDLPLFIVELIDETNYRLQEMRDHELMATFGTVMRNLNHSLRGPLSTAKGITQLYKLKNVDNIEMLEGFNMVGTVLDKLDEQLEQSIKGLEGYEKVWMKDKAGSNLKTVLIIDDNERDLLILKRIIEELHPEYNVISFSDSQMAVFFIQNLIKRVEYIFLDLEMPNLDGAGVIREIHKKRIHVVNDVYFISGHDISYLEKLDLNDSEFEMIKGFIPKPFSYDQLKTLLQSAK